jgi:hypothetical protein
MKNYRPVSGDGSAPVVLNPDSKSRFTTPGQKARTTAVQFYSRARIVYRSPNTSWRTLFGSNAALDTNGSRRQKALDDAETFQFELKCLGLYQRLTKNFAEILKKTEMLEATRTLSGAQTFLSPKSRILFQGGFTISHPDFDVLLRFRFNAPQFTDSRFMNGTQIELKPLPYHEQLRDYLRSHEKELWDWFASAQAKADYAEHLRIELLKTTYRLDPKIHAELYRALDEAKASLNLDIPVTLYQAQQSQNLNASLLHLPGEGHIIFCGSILALLNADEIKSVLGHELAHYHFWNCQGGDFQIADRLLQAIANDPRAGASHIQSARRFQLYTEIFCDRGSFCVSQDVQPVISSLVKIQTGLPQVSAASYLKQAEEIFSAAKVRTEELSHPEAFIRGRAVDLWAREHADTDGAISAMIEGVAVLDELDVVEQQNLTKATRILIEELLRPKWFQTPAVLGHASLFFEGFHPGNGTNDALLSDLKFNDPKLQEYLCYLLLDFVVADRELEELPLAAALELARRLEIETLFEKIALKELKVKAKELRKLKEQASVLLAKAEAEQ